MPFRAAGQDIPDEYFADPVNPTIAEVHEALDVLVPRDTQGRFVSPAEVEYPEEPVAPDDEVSFEDDDS